MWRPTAQERKHPETLLILRIMWAYCRTSCMEQSVCSEVNIRLLTQTFQTIHRNYSGHKTSPVYCILASFNEIHTPLLQIYFNIILHIHLVPISGVLLSDFLTNSFRISHVPVYATCSAHPIFRLIALIIPYLLKSTNMKLRKEEKRLIIFDRSTIFYVKRNIRHSHSEFELMLIAAYVEKA